MASQQQQQQAQRPRAALMPAPQQQFGMQSFRPSGYAAVQGLAGVAVAGGAGALVANAGPQTAGGGILDQLKKHAGAGRLGSKGGWAWRALALEDRGRAGAPGRAHPTARFRAIRARADKMINEQEDTRLKLEHYVSSARPLVGGGLLRRTTLRGPHASPAAPTRACAPE
jgi:hypothetical protein